MRRGLGRGVVAWIAGVLALVIFLAINLIGQLTLGGVQADLTAERLYTLAPGAQEVVESLKEPVHLRLYETRGLVDSVPALQAFAPQVIQTLRTFSQLSNGKLQFEIVDTLPFSAEEDRAQGVGLAGFNLNTSGERGYFGIIGTNTLDRLEIINVLDPSRQGLLQYDLSRLIYRLSQPTEPRVGIIDGLGMYGSQSSGRRPWAILNIIADNYALSDLTDETGGIPADVDVLLIAHPAHLSDRQKYDVDQYVLRGGPLLVFIDPLAENSPPDPANPMRPAEPSSRLDPLLASWGVTMDPTKVVGDRNMALQIVGQAGNQRVVADYLPWLRVDGAALNPDEPITARLRVMRLSSAGALVPVAGATTSATPLIQSTGASMLLDRDELETRPNPNTLLDQFQASGQRQLLAARITGPAKTAYPGGAPRPAEGTPALPNAPAPLTQSSGPINVIVVADTDMLADNHVVDQNGRLSTSNADFVMNAIEQLAGGSALVNIRGGGQVVRPFTLLLAMQDRAQAAYRETEDRLTQELQQVQENLAKLQGPNAGPDQSGQVTLSKEQQDAVEQFNQRSAELRQQLRNVQHALRADVENLQNRLELINIAAVPILLLVLSGLAALWTGLRLRRYRRGHRAVRASA